MNIYIYIYDFKESILVKSLILDKLLDNGYSHQ